MLVLLARRLLIVVPLLLAVSLLVYALVEMFPGDACVVKHEKHATEEILAGCRREYNLEGPLLHPLRALPGQRPAGGSREVDLPGGTGSRT